MIKNEQLEVIEFILQFESVLTLQTSDEFAKYVHLGLELEPNSSSMLEAYGHFMMGKQYNSRFDNPSEVDYSYIDFFEKAVVNEKFNLRRRQSIQNTLQYAILHRDYHLGSVKQINHLIQFDTRPNAIVEPQWEIYRITISFIFKGFNLK